MKPAADRTFCPSGADARRREDRPPGWRRAELLRAAVGAGLAAPDFWRERAASLLG